MTEVQYQQEIDWLFRQIPNYQNVGKAAYKPGLDNIMKLCDFFGNPQDQLKSIHIGGTNGKGSTSNMVASVLQEAGYRVGLYTSPHLIEFTERIKINGENCPKEFVYEFIKKLRTLPADIYPSFFEFTTIMAFVYFAERKVDFAVIEVGLGGRLDATNIIKPLVTAITNVDLDHQDLLGYTIEEIAEEKAGIIKSDVPVISGTENPVVKNILRSKAGERKTDFIDATSVETSLSSDLKGKYQIKNIKVALSLIKILESTGVKIGGQNVIKGLMKVSQNTGFIGRWYQFSDNPLIICDTAHNQAGLSLVFEQLNAIDKFKHVILGFVNEKKIDEVLKILPHNSIFYFAPPNIARGRHPQDYEDMLKKSKIIYKIFDQVQEAYLFATQQLKNDEMIFIGGSNFVVGEFLEKNLEH